MSNFLRVKGFKRIDQDIYLQNFGNVNYLVGKNGCGKTSILNAIGLLNDERLAQPFLEADSTVELVIDGAKSYIVHNPTLQNGERKTNGDLKIKCYVQKNDGFRELNADVAQLEFDYSLEQYGPKEKDTYFDFLNMSANKIGMPSIDQVNSGTKWAPRIGFTQSGKSIELSQLSQGLKNLNNLNVLLNALETDLNNGWYLENYSKFFVLIEEPENNLHPELQKLIPTLIAEFLSKIDTSVVSNVHFFVSTHSPFVIGAASDYIEQKVYLLGDGLLGEIDKNGTSVNLVSKSEGYSGQQCAWVVGQMLGADITDLGYPENYCILEEYSLQVILEDALKKNIIKNWQFISASGESNVIKITERMDNVEKLSTLVKCNPYYYGKYCVIVDSTKAFADEKKTKFINLKSRLGSRFIELTKNGIEDFYPNIDETLYEECRVSLAKVKNDNAQEGVIKAACAKQIAIKINSKGEFSKLFGGELDFLLK